MASAKLGTLIIRTVAKPISNSLKSQAKQHESFRNFCVSLAQWMYRGEVKLRTGLLGEPAKHLRPLSETKAIENGANALAEGFLFAVAAGLIIGETWRSSRSQTKRRDSVDDQLDALASKLEELGVRVDDLASEKDEAWQYERQKNEELSRILERVVEIGMRGGWAVFEDDPIQIPKIELVHRPASSQPSPPIQESSHRIEPASDTPPDTASP